MLAGADGATAAGQRGVVTGVGDVFESHRNRSFVSERRKDDAESDGRRMKDDAGLEAGMKPLPAHHDRARDSALRSCAGADRFATCGTSTSARLLRARRIGTGGIALESARNRGQKAAHRKWFLDKVSG